MGSLDLLVENRWLIVGCFIALYILEKLLTYNRLRHFKGPISCGFSNFLHTKAVLSLQCEKWYGEMADKYGVYVICDNAHTPV